MMLRNSSGIIIVFVQLKYFINKKKNIERVFEEEKLKMDRKKKNQKYTSRPFLKDKGSNVDNMLINNDMRVIEINKENLVVNKMQLVLIFLMVK
jgi:hypothetical protein